MSKHLIDTLWEASKERDKVIAEVQSGKRPRKRPLRGKASRAPFPDEIAQSLRRLILQSHHLGDVLGDDAGLQEKFDEATAPGYRSFTHDRSKYQFDFLDDRLETANELAEKLLCDYPSMAPKRVQSTRRLARNTVNILEDFHALSLTRALLCVLVPQAPSFFVAGIFDRKRASSSDYWLRVDTAMAIYVIEIFESWRIGLTTSLSAQAGMRVWNRVELSMQALVTTSTTSSNNVSVPELIKALEPNNSSNVFFSTYIRKLAESAVLRADLCKRLQASETTDVQWPRHGEKTWNMTLDTIFGSDIAHTSHKASSGSTGKRRRVEIPESGTLMLQPDELASNANNVERGLAPAGNREGELDIKGVARADVEHASAAETGMRTNTHTISASTPAGTASLHELPFTPIVVELTSRDEQGEARRELPFSALRQNQRADMNQKQVMKEGYVCGYTLGLARFEQVCSQFHVHPESLGSRAFTAGHVTIEGLAKDRYFQSFVENAFASALRAAAYTAVGFADIRIAHDKCQRNQERPRCCKHRATKAFCVNKNKPCPCNSCMEFLLTSGAGLIVYGEGSADEGKSPADETFVSVTVRDTGVFAVYKGA